MTWFYLVPSGSLLEVHQHLSHHHRLQNRVILLILLVVIIVLVIREVSVTDVDTNNLRAKILVLTDHMDDVAGDW